jgi:hypothetical protein
MNSTGYTLICIQSAAGKSAMTSPAIAAHFARHRIDRRLLRGSGSCLACVQG